MEFGSSQKNKSEASIFPTLKRNAAVMGYSNTKSRGPITKTLINRELKTPASSRYPSRFQTAKHQSTLLSASKICAKPCTIRTNEYKYRNVQICYKRLHFLKLRILSCEFYKKDEEINNNNNNYLVKETITNTLVQVCQLFPDMQKLDDENKWCSCRQYSRNCPNCKNAIENVCDYLSDASKGKNYQSTSLENASAKLKCNLNNRKSSSGYSSLKLGKSSKHRPSSSSSKNAASFKKEFKKSCELFDKTVEKFTTRNVDKHTLKVLYKASASNFEKSGSKMEIDISKITNKAQSEEQEVVLTSFVEKYINCKVTFRNGSLNFASDNWHDPPEKISTLLLCDSNNDYTQNFLMSVISIYEKEHQFCTDLFNDKLFEKKLLMAAEDKCEREKKNKKGIFTKIIRNTRISMCLKQKDTYNGNCKATNKCINDELIECQQKVSTLATATKKSFKMLAEATKENGSVDDIIKICGILRLLERIENHDFDMTGWPDKNICEDTICAELIEVFANVYNYCRKEAKKHKKQITKEQVELLKLFVIKHKMFELVSGTNFVASKITNGFIETEEQLKRSSEDDKQ